MCVRHRGQLQRAVSLLLRNGVAAKTIAYEVRISVSTVYRLDPVFFAGPRRDDGKARKMGGTAGSTRANL